MYILIYRKYKAPRHCKYEKLLVLNSCKNQESGFINHKVWVQETNVPDIFALFMNLQILREEKPVIRLNNSQFKLF